jgi:hypothetical protein
MVTNLDAQTWRESRSVTTTGTYIDLERAWLMAEILEICGYKPADTTAMAVSRDDDTSGWTEEA